MKITVVDHPVAATHLTELRDAANGRDRFRQHLDAVAGVLVAEALRDALTTQREVVTPMGTAAGACVDPMPTVVPILRAGLGMLDAALRWLPDAPVAYLGVQRIESDGADGVGHRHYLETLPSDVSGRPALVLDPMLATGGTVIAACLTLAEAGAGPITVVCALAAPEGIEAVTAACSQHLDVHLVTAAVDSHLDERAYIVPGLGDAGDRLYGES